MPREILCPHCGLSIQVDSNEEFEVGLEHGQTVELVDPVNSSRDSLSKQTSLGPLDLDSHTTDGLESHEDIRAEELTTEAGVSKPKPRSRPKGVPRAKEDLSKGLVEEFRIPMSASNPELPALGTDEIHLDSRSGSGTRISGRKSRHGGRLNSWAILLMGSYASAMTIALGWFLLKGRGNNVPVAPPPASKVIPTDSRSDSAKIGQLHWEDNQSKSLPRENVIRLKRSIRMGDLEVSALGVRSGPVSLVHSVGRKARRQGGDDALRLKLHFRNLSEKDSLKPIEPGFVRERDRGLPDSYIEPVGGERIMVYPLAASSEWSIDGQKFPELEPGQETDFELVSEKDALERAKRRHDLAIFGSHQAGRYDLDGRPFRKE